MNFLLFASHIPLKKFQIYWIYHFLGLRLRLRLEVLFNSFLNYPIALFKVHVPGFNRSLLGFFSFSFFFGGSLAGAATFFAGSRFCFFAGGGEGDHGGDGDT